VIDSINWVRPGATVTDVGINRIRTPEKGREAAPG
jgi:5,10-methylene-tetrahydrofolate dehydrogenase/methenyl tetrahydrofolate cyclohydrolase